MIIRLETIKTPKGFFIYQKLLAAAPSAAIAHLAPLLEHKAAIARWADALLDLLRF
jgi:hypothetical protein